MTIIRHRITVRRPPRGVSVSRNKLQRSGSCSGKASKVCESKRLYTASAVDQATGSDIDHRASKRFEGCHNYWQFRSAEFLVFGSHSQARTAKQKMLAESGTRVPDLKERHGVRMSVEDQVEVVARDLRAPVLSTAAVGRSTSRSTKGGDSSSR
jgi:hypothetical protein